MSWKNVQIDGVPADREQVLISYRGIYYIASYRAERREFEDTETGYVVRITENLNVPVYWQPMAAEVA